MPRIRTIKPEFWTDTKVIGLSVEARLLFLGSWNFADDYGCLAPDAMQLKLRVLPTSTADACELVAEIFAAGLFERLRGQGGRDFWHVTNWSKHQRVNRPTESEYGLPTEWKPAATGGFSEDSLSDHGAVRDDSVSTHDGMEGKGTERKGEDYVLKEGKSEGEDPMLPAHRALRQWAEIRGLTPTARWIHRHHDKALDFLTTYRLTGQPDQVDEFLQWAAEDGCEDVGGWPSWWQSRAIRQSKNGPRLSREELEAQAEAVKQRYRDLGVET